MRAPMGPGGEEHRGRERGIPDRRLRIGSVTAFLGPKAHPGVAEQATAPTLYNHAIHDMQLLQAMSEEEKYEGAQGDHNHNARRTGVLRIRKPTHPPGDRNVSRASLESSYSTGVTTYYPLGGRGE